MKRVTGIGGIIFKADNPEKIKEWYKTNDLLKTYFTRIKSFRSDSRFEPDMNNSVQLFMQI